MSQSLGLDGVIAAVTQALGLHAAGLVSGGLVS